MGSDVAEVGNVGEKYYFLQDVYNKIYKIELLIVGYASVMSLAVQLRN